MYPKSDLTSCAYFADTCWPFQSIKQALVNCILKLPQLSISWKDIKLSQQESDSLRNIKESVAIFKHSYHINSSDSYPLSHFRQLHTSSLSQLSCGDHDFFLIEIFPPSLILIFILGMFWIRRKYFCKFPGSGLNTY